ncbi:MAG: SMC-Scp complex subunit ScpB [Nitrospinota bacterium]
MEKEQAVNILEVILFVSDAPVSAENICHVIDGLERGDVPDMISELNSRMDGRGLEAVEIAGGYQLRSRQEFGQWVKRFHKMRRSTRLSQASLETLSIIAYRQPITRQEIEDIRGVDSSGPVKTLLDKNLIKSMGRKKVPGKPMTFGTSGKFLEYFGLVKLSDLPTLKDFPSGEGDQQAIGFDEPVGEEGKNRDDTQLEEEAAMTEPAEEDYADETADDEVTDDFSENETDTAAENSG